MTTREISNSDDVIDSRDVIERIEELEAELEEAAEGAGMELAAFVEAQANDENATLQDAAKEYRILLALQDEAEGYSEDWKYGSTLIRDSYFTDYTEEMLKDCGDLPRDIPHYIAIDWEKTAENIQVDYTSVDFGGVTYWVR